MRFVVLGVHLIFHRREREVGGGRWGGKRETKREREKDL
jgi:hypothetical protein